MYKRVLRHTAWSGKGGRGGGGGGSSNTLGMLNVIKGIWDKPQLFGPVACVHLTYFLPYIF